VVAAIFTSQNNSVTSGTLAKTLSAFIAAALPCNPVHRLQGRT